jgi:hypothetical protein
MSWYLKHYWGRSVAVNPSTQDRQLFTVLAQSQLEKVDHKYGDRVTIKKCKGGTGYNKPQDNGTFILCVPKPTTLMNLRALVHETEHALLGHNEYATRDDASMSHVEYEADTKALEVMEAAGVRIPESLRKHSREDVAVGVAYDLSHGIKPDARAIDYADKAMIRRMSSKKARKIMKQYFDEGRYEREATRNPCACVPNSLNRKIA